ncbi:hypothetical protein Tco_0741006, partial [Tanacetum coccineum]
MALIRSLLDKCCDRSLLGGVLRRYKIVILRIFLPELYLPSYVSTTEKTAELAATTETETEVAVEKAGVMSNIRKQDKDAMESAAEKALAQILEVSALALLTLVIVNGTHQNDITKNYLSRYS